MTGVIKLCVDCRALILIGKTHTVSVIIIIWCAARFEQTIKLGGGGQPRAIIVNEQFVWSPPPPPIVQAKRGTAPGYLFFSFFFFYWTCAVGSCWTKLLLTYMYMKMWIYIVLLFYTFFKRLGTKWFYFLNPSWLRHQREPEHCQSAQPDHSLWCHPGGEPGHPNPNPIPYPHLTMFPLEDFLRDSEIHMFAVFFSFYLFLL